MALGWQTKKYIRLEVKRTMNNKGKNFKKQLGIDVCPVCGVEKGDRN